MLTGMNEFGRLKRLAMRRPLEAMRHQGKIDAEWRDLNYHTRPDFGVAEREHDAFAAVIRSVGAEITYLPDDAALTMDSLYVRDAAAVSPKGVILCNMGKPARRGEPGIHGKAFEAAGIPVLGAVTGSGNIEGGDLKGSVKTFVIDDPIVAPWAVYEAHIIGQVTSLEENTGAVFIEIIHR